MPYMQKIPEADFTGQNYGFAQMPNTSACLAYHLFGGSQAASIANRVNSAAPLNVTGTPTYESNCAVLVAGGTSYFTTPFTGQNANRTCILIGTDEYTPISTPGTPTAAAQPGGVNFLQWNGGGQFLRWLGSIVNFRAGTGGDDVADSSPKTPAHYFFPDGTQRISKFRTLIVSGDATTATLITMNGTAFKTTTLTRTTSVPADAATIIGSLASTSANQFRVAAFAQFTTLTAAQALASAAFMAADVEARGIDFIAPHPNLPV